MLGQSTFSHIRRSFMGKKTVSACLWLNSSPYMFLDNGLEEVIGRLEMAGFKYLSFGLEHVLPTTDERFGPFFKVSTFHALA